ncbi:MAG: hypothetical protein NWQ55_07680 [Salibacteraceae bacterium]|nr:hypothetical protein [Salibacteraceae bacterium]
MNYQKLALIILTLLTTKTGFGQREGCFDYTIDFEESYCIDQLKIDTISDTNNVWQIAQPQKTILNSTKNGNYVIITDSAQVYPSHDTSIFVVKNPAGGGFVWPHTAGLHGYYWANSDTLNDFGEIEFSPDNGNTWINLITDTVYNDNYYWWGEKPTLTGNSNGWKKFDVSLSDLGYVFNIDYTDTIQYRFTFVSDSIQDSLGGLMYDLLYFEDWAEGINDVSSNSFNIEISPNPAQEFLRVSCMEDSPSIHKFEFSIYKVH